MKNKKLIILLNHEYTPSTDSEVTDSVIIRFQNPRISEYFITKSVQPIQDNLNRDSSNPFLENFGFFKVLSRRSSIESGKGDITTSKRRNIRKLSSTLGNSLVSRKNWSLFWHLISRLTRAGIELPGNPFSIKCRFLVNCEGLWSWRNEFQPHISDVESLPEDQGKGDIIGVLYTISHCIRLPPSLLIRVIKVCQEVRRMIVTLNIFLDCV